MNKIVYIRRTNRKQGEVVSSAGNSVAAPFKGNSLVAVLTPAEQADMEKKLHRQPGALDIYHPTETNFWYSDEAKFTMRGYESKLNLEIPIDFIQYKILKASGVLGTDHNSKKYDYYETTKSTEAATNVAVVQLINLSNIMANQLTTNYERVGFLIEVVRVPMSHIPTIVTAKELIDILTNFVSSGTTLNEGRLRLATQSMPAIGDLEASCILGAALVNGDIVRISNTKKPYQFGTRKLGYEEIKDFITKGIAQNLAVTTDLITKLKEVYD